MKCVAVKAVGCRAVECVAQNWVADVGAVETNLVRAARFWHSFYESAVLVVGYSFKGGPGDAAFKVMTNHTPWVEWVAHDIIGYGTRSRRMASDQGEIGFLYGAFFKKCYERLVAMGRLGNQQEPRGVFIESMHNARSVGLADACDVWVGGC